MLLKPSIAKQSHILLSAHGTHSFSYKKTLQVTKRARPSHLLNAITKSTPKDKLFSSRDENCHSSLKCTVKGRQAPAFIGQGLTFGKDALL